MKEGHDVFVPVFWVNHLEIMAYSVKGRTGIWHFERMDRNRKGRYLYVQ